MAAVSDLIVRKVPDPKYSAFIKRMHACSLLEGAWVAGGSVRKVWHGLPWQREDVDFFFSSPDQFRGFVNGIDARYGMDSNSGSTWENLDMFKKQASYASCYVTDNANTYTIIVDDGEQDAHTFKVQAIKRTFYESVEALFKSFDFTVCQFATDGELMVATPEALSDCSNGLLRMSKDSDRKVSVVRVMKYGSYGFNPVDELMSEVLDSVSSGTPLEIPDDY